MNIDNKRNQNTQQEEEKKSVHGKFTQNLQNESKDKHSDSKDLKENVQEQEVKEISPQDEIDNLKKVIESLNNKYLREAADKENMKRIMQKNTNDAIEYAVKDFARDIIRCCDNLERILSMLEEDNDLNKGIKMTWDGFIKTLDDHGVKRIDPIGEPFNPNFHQSICQILDTTKSPGTIIEVRQPGYTIKSRLLRPAMVIISKENE